jgi:hypothetical protein
MISFKKYINTVVNKEEKKLETCDPITGKPNENINIEDITPLEYFLEKQLKENCLSIFRAIKDGYIPSVSINVNITRCPITKKATIPILVQSFRDYLLNHTMGTLGGRANEEFVVEKIKEWFGPNGFAPLNLKINFKYDWDSIKNIKKKTQRFWLILVMPRLDQCANLIRG